MKEPKDESAQDSDLDLEATAAISDLVDDALKGHPVGAFRGELKTPDRKINPVRMEKGWYTKSEQAQRREIQRKLGSRRPESDDPIPQKPPPKGVVEGRLFDPHPLSRVRKRDVEATLTIRAAIEAPLPVKPVKPGAAEEPIPGRCWECYRPLRKRDRAGTKFCTGNMGECRKTYNAREADRAERAEIWKEWDASRHAERMFSIHQVVADVLSNSAARLGIEASFVANPDGVLAVHDAPLPPIGPQVWVKLEGDHDGHIHKLEVIATVADGGTLYEFGINLPEWYADRGCVWVMFEGDPGVGHVCDTAPPPILNVRQAILTNRVAEYLAAGPKNAKTDYFPNSTSENL